MNTISKGLAVAALALGLTAPLPAAVTVSVDMDPAMPGIQSSRAATVGQVITVDLVLAVGAEGVSSYGISVNFDNAELSLNGALASTELLPGGFAFNLNPGVSSESQALGQVRTFEAATLGIGPASTIFVIGSIHFTVAAPVTDGTADVTPGLFNAGVDGCFDNAGNAAAPVFVSGRVDLNAPGAPIPAFSGTILLDGDISDFFQADGVTPKRGVCVANDPNGLDESPLAASSTLDTQPHPSGFNQRRILTAYNPNLNGGTIYVGIDLPGGTGADSSSRTIHSTPGNANPNYFDGVVGQNLGGNGFGRGKILPFDADGNGEADTIGRKAGGGNLFRCGDFVAGDVRDIVTCSGGAQGLTDNPRQASGETLGARENYVATILFGNGANVTVELFQTATTPDGIAQINVSGTTVVPFGAMVSTAGGGSGAVLGFDVEMAVTNVNNAVPDVGARLHQLTVIDSGSNRDGASQGEDQNIVECTYDVSSPITMNCPGNVVAECTGGLTPVNFTVTAADASGPVPVTCVPPSGTGFRLGTSNVVCTVIDTTVSCGFTVTVVDTQPPILTLTPANPQTNFQCFADYLAAPPILASASDNCDGTNVILTAISSISGTTCPILISICWTAIDHSSNSQSLCVFIKIKDTIPPVIRCPANIVVNCGSTAPPSPLSVAGFRAIGGFASDNCDTNLQYFSFDGPRIGDQIVRTHTVCDDCTNCASCTQIITFTCDVPVISCSTNIVAECSGGLTPVTFSVTATNFNGPVPVTCVPPSGTGFRLGTSNVICTATSGGSSVSCPFTVTVVDTTPPQVTCPGDITALATNASGAVVHYTSGAFDACDLADFSCSPPTGSVFPIGTTAATCTASDPSRNTNSCRFRVVVLGARGIKLDCLTNLVALRAGVTNRHDGEELDDAIEHLTRSLEPALWIDEIHLQRKGGDKVFEEEKKAVHELVELLKDKHGTVAGADLHALIDCILRADRMLAVKAVDDAVGVKPKKIAEDRKEIDKGDEDAVEGKYEEAIEHYRNAWKHAVHIKIEPPHRLATGGAHLTFIAIEQETYVIQASADLIHWVSIGTATANADGEVALEDPVASGQTSRFYRVVAP